MKYSVYKYTTPNGKIYIGITHQHPSKRWGSGYNYDYNIHFFNAIKKYGWDNIKHEVLFENLTREEARAKEIELISLYDSTNRDKGYNISPGGEMQTQETKEKIEKTRQERKLDELQSVRSKKRWEDPIFREKTIKNMRGKIRTPESKERYRQAMLKRGSPKIESIEKMRQTLRAKIGEESIRKRPVLQIAPVTLEVVGRFWTAREAAQAVGASINYIATVCRKSGNETRASHGYFWCYEDEYYPELFEKYRGLEFSSSGKLPRSAPGHSISGNRNSFFGKTHSQKTKEVISSVHSKPIRCIETGKTYKSIREAATEFGVDSSTIGKCLVGKSKTSCGYHWEYISRK